MMDPRRPWRIVIVDDNLHDRLEVKAALLRGSDRRYDFVETDTGAGGLRLIRSGPLPDCVVLDYSLPDMTAVEVLAELTGEAGVADMPVVVLTGSVGPEVNSSVLRAGAEGFVGKDWLTPDSLTRVVENAVERHAMAAELRRTTEALAQREHRLRLALEGAGIGMWEWDFGTDAVSWSPECYAIHGVALDGFDGTPAGFGRLVHPDDVERVWAAVRAAAAEQSFYEAEFRIVRPDGEVRWVSNKGRALYDAEGRPTRMIGIIADVSGAKRIEAEREQLLAAERAARGEMERMAQLKDEFLATLSHELRTPLNAIVGWAQILQRADPGNARVIREGVSVIARNADNQAQLINDLLDMNRIVSGKLKMEVGPLDPNLLAAAAADTVRPAAEAKGVILELSLGTGLAQVNGDEGRLRQVLWNLLTNAVKFTPIGGRVTLSTGQLDGMVRLTVEDTGQGLAPEFLPRLFDRFSQQDSSAARKHGGLGLGLSIVKQLVELHGGAVTAESEGPGRGSRFTVNLPAGLHAKLDSVFLPPTAPPPVIGLEPVDEMPHLSLRGLSILLVEDQPDTLEAVRRLLTEYGAVVATAASSEAAVAQLRREVPHLLLSDIGLPEKDGFQLIREVRDGLGLGPAALPAVALTAFARTEDQERALAAGFQAHVAKPLRPQILVPTLAALARRGPSPAA